MRLHARGAQDRGHDWRRPGEIMVCAVVSVEATKLLGRCVGVNGCGGGCLAAGPVCCFCWIWVPRAAVHSFM